MGHCHIRTLRVYNRLDSATIVPIYYQDGKWFKDGQAIPNVEISAVSLRKSFPYISETLHIVTREFYVLCKTHTTLSLTMKAVSPLDGTSVSWTVDKTVPSRVAMALYLVSTCDEPFSLIHWPCDKERSVITSQYAFVQLRQVMPVDTIVVLVLGYFLE